MGWVIGSFKRTQKNCFFWGKHKNFLFGLKKFFWVQISLAGCPRSVHYRLLLVFKSYKETSERYCQLLLVSEQNLRKMHLKEILFSKPAGLQLTDLLKKELFHRQFPKILSKFEKSLFSGKTLNVCLKSTHITSAVSIALMQNDEINVDTNWFSFLTTVRNPSKFWKVKGLKKGPGCSGQWLKSTFPGKHPWQNGTSKKI